MENNYVLDSLDKSDPNSIIFDGVTLDVVTNQSNKDKKGETESTNLENGDNGLFITDEKANQMNHEGIVFFKLLNSLTGNIFECNKKTGEIYLGKNKSTNNITSNKNTSLNLAKLIEENIGVNAKQRILFRVGKYLNQIDFDGYINGKVDIEDLKFNNTDKYKETLQSCMIYHFTNERVNTENYEKIKDQMLNFNILHTNARNAEMAVWNEMQNETITSVIEQNWLPNHPKTNKVDGINFYKSIYYGEHFRLIIQRNKNTQKLYFDYEIY
jgi:hypothetical protein